MYFKFQFISNIEGIINLHDVIELESTNLNEKYPSVCLFIVYIEYLVANNIF